MMKSTKDSIKHIFIVHSNITLLAFLAVKNTCNLSARDIIVVRFRGYNHPLIECYESYYFNKIEIKFSFLTWFFKLQKLIKKVDDFIGSLGISYYNLYLPHSNSFTYQAFSSHRNCLSFSYIEEGTLAYTSKKRTKDLNYFFYKLITSSRLYGVSYPDFILPNYKELFAFSKDAFKFDNKKKVVLNLRELKVSNYNFQIKDKSVVAVLDSTDISMLPSFDTILCNIKDILKRNNLYNVAFKFHPQHYKDNLVNDRILKIEQKFKIIDNNKNNVKVTILDPSVILELEFLHAKDILLLYGRSSLSLYIPKSHSKLCFLHPFSSDN